MITSVTASEDVRAQNWNRAAQWRRELWGLNCAADSTRRKTSCRVAKVVRKGAPERVKAPSIGHSCSGVNRSVIVESHSLGMLCKLRGIRLVRLNTAQRPIANK